MPTTTTSPRRGVALLALALLAFAAAPPAAAESTPEAREWLEKLIGVYDRGPFTVDFSAEIDLAQTGQPMRGDLSGKVTYGDNDRVRMEMKMALSGMPGASGTDPQAPMEMEMLSVSDGIVIWTEMSMPAVGTRQVMKLYREDAEKMAASAVGGLGTNPASLDPVAQLETMTRIMDFELVGTAGGRVTLEGRVVDEASRDQLGQMAALGADSFLLILDASTGFPVEMRTGGEDPALRMEFTNLRFLDDLPEGIFAYSPPEGVPVMDLGAMLPTQGGQ